MHYTMAFISVQEVMDIIVMTLAVGFIFKDAFKPRYVDNYEPLAHSPLSFTWKELLFAALITAPGIVFHELAHKFVALGLGVSATFHAAYFWLVVGIVLKLVNFNFIFFVPGYVSHAGLITPLQSALISVAGPFLNLVLWLGPWALLKSSIKLSQKQKYALALTKQINMFLFIFNMLPIPPFDGGHFFSALWQMLF